MQEWLVLMVVGAMPTLLPEFAIADARRDECVGGGGGD